MQSPESKKDTCGEMAASLGTVSWHRSTQTTQPLHTQDFKLQWSKWRRQSYLELTCTGPNHSEVCLAPLSAHSDSEREGEAEKFFYNAEAVILSGPSLPTTDVFLGQYLVPH